MKYVVEYYVSQDDTSPRLTGPFESVGEAAQWAVDHLVLPWTVRALHITPKKG